MKPTLTFSSRTARLHRCAAIATRLARKSRRVCTNVSDQQSFGTNGILSNLPLLPIGYHNVVARARPSQPEPEPEAEPPKPEAETEPENDPRKAEGPATKKSGGYGE